MKQDREDARGTASPGSGATSRRPGSSRSRLLPAVRCSRDEWGRSRRAADPRPRPGRRLTVLALLLIAGAARAGEPRLPAVAVLPLEAKGLLEDHVVEALDDWLSVGVRKTGSFEVVHRDKMDEILKEFRLQKSDLCDTTKCYAELGGAMGAEKLVVGSIADLGGTEYLVVLKLIDITEIREEFSDRAAAASTGELRHALDRLVAAMVGAGPSSSPPGGPPAEGGGRPAGSVPGERGERERAAADGVPLPAGVRREGDRLVREGDGAEVLLVPAGRFRMGSTDEEVEAAKALARAWNREPKAHWYRDEQPAHELELGAFYVDRFEVTNARYARFVRETGRRPPANSVDERYNVSDGSSYPEELGRHPVVNVSWADATAYCAWAGARLPTEAEWEKAARGTDGRRFPWGERWDDARANRGRYDAEEGMWYGDGADGYERTAPVGSFPSGASPYGAEDLAGNVWEWVSDWYDADYYQRAPRRDPAGPASGEDRVLRGGSWGYEPDSLRASYRARTHPSRRNRNVGFRCAQDPE